MAASTSFPARTVVTSFVECEEALAKVLRIVPWCTQHESVWSPTLTTVIMEACSQLDSLWGHEAWLSPYVRAKKKRRDLTVCDHFQHFSNKSLTPLGARWVVFWGGDPAQIRPFEAWADPRKYAALEWWNVYNKLKHDRLENQEKATLLYAVSAVAGLFLAILLSDHCRYAVEAAGWLSASDAVSYNPKASLGEDSQSIKEGYVLAESKLFSYPVGWCTQAVKRSDEWRGNASMQFKHWFSEYSTE